MRRQKVTYENEYRDLPINANREKGLGCLSSSLQSYREKLDYMTDNHSKLLQVRFDLRYPSDNSVPYDKKHISRFCEYFKRSFDRNKTSPHSVDAKLDWVPDKKEKSSHPHYHCLALVNGNAIQSEYTIFKTAEHYWGVVLKSSQEGLVDYCNKSRNGGRQENGMMYRRGFEDAEETLEKMHYQASYIAKARDKEGLPKGAWIRGGSRIPKK